MSGIPNPVTMRFRKIVTSGLAMNTIRFATAASFGHRVSVNVTSTQLGGIFKWSRTKNTSVPKSILNPLTADGKDKLATLIATLLTTTYTDKDAKVNGLDFNSSTLTTMEALPISAPVRVSAGISSANDLVMAYVLFRCFGKTNYSDISQIYNLADAYAMVDDAVLGNAIADAMDTNPTEVESFLQEQLKYDTARYISGNTLPTGMFDSNGDDAETADSTGDMVWVTGDIIEIPVRLVFRAPVTVANMSDDVVYSSGAKSETEVIAGEGATWTDTVAPAAANVLAFRLQLTVS
jgi:hypothetical protein